MTALTTDQVKHILCYGFESYVGHATTAVRFSELLGLSIGENRVEVTFGLYDQLVIGLSTPPRRLALGERWTEEEILSFEINWVFVQKRLTETIKFIQGDYTETPVL